jgi:predicted nucleic acid-binding protein
MMLVDSSVWIDHLRHGEAELVGALNQSLILIHPFVLGELACGNLKSRASVLALLAALPAATLATDEETMAFIEQHSLMGRGIGYIDAHLCASARLSGALLWTRDKRLRDMALGLGCGYQETTH